MVDIAVHLADRRSFVDGHVQPDPNVGWLPQRRFAAYLLNDPRESKKY